MNEIKLCIDCKHCRIKTYEKLHTSYYFCDRPALLDVVSGQAERHCATERYDEGVWRVISGDCGKIGK